MNVVSCPLIQNTETQANFGVVQRMKQQLSKKTQTTTYHQSLVSWFGEIVNEERSRWHLSDGAKHQQSEQQRAL